MHLSRRTLLAGLASIGLAPLASPAGASQNVAEGQAAPEAASRTFRIGVPAKALSTDPCVTNDIETHRLARQVYQNLIGVDPETGETLAELATDWTFSDDGLQLVLELEHDVSFHDGTELTADVVVKNFERWGSVNELLGAERLRQVGRLPYSVVFGGYFDQDACPLASVEASSEHIVTLTFTEPIQALIRSLTHPAFAISSPGSWADFDAALQDGLPLVPLAGTGPYRWGDTSGETIGLESVNDGHDVAVLAIPNLHERLYGLDTQQLDVFDAVSPAILRELVQSGYQVLQRDPLAVLYLGMNQAHPVMQNLHVRQAVAHALFRGDMVDSLQLDGSYVAHQFNPPSLLERSDDVATYNGDLNRATNLLAAAGYDGEPIEFWYPTGAERVYMTQPQKLFSYLAGRLTAAGFNIVAKPVSWDDGDYMSQVMGDASDRALHLFGRNVYVRDPLYLLAELFEQPNREFGWRNTAVADVLAQARVEDDTDARTAMLSQVEAAISLDLPAIPLTFPITALASGHDVEFYPISPVLDEQYERIQLRT
ncbi:MAG: ABC transporter substrate-binding protein [Yaniella sp.]|nr:ABC transporter substrate-binding protein [Yaniella sp.]